MFDRKRLAHHICHDYCSTFCNRPAALLLLFFLLSREGANGVDDKKEVVGGEQGWWCYSEYCLLVLHSIIVDVGVRRSCRRSYRPSSLLLFLLGEKEAPDNTQVF